MVQNACVILQNKSFVRKYANFKHVCILLKISHFCIVGKFLFMFCCSLYMLLRDKSSPLAMQKHSFEVVKALL